CLSPLRGCRARTGFPRKRDAQVRTLSYSALQQQPPEGIMKERAARAAAQSGITLIEVCIVIAVAMVLLGNVLPSFQATLTRRTLEGHAAELAGDVQYLRSQAVSSHRTLRISFHTYNGGSCYVIHSGSAG